MAQGLSGPLYYGAGRYAVADIAPVYCPQGTSAWISNVTAFMAELGADPADTRWAAGHDGDGAVILTTRGLTLALQRPIGLRRSHSRPGRVEVRCTLTDTGTASGTWQAVILRLEGPGGRSLAYGANGPFTVSAGGSYAFVANLTLDAPGAWSGWVDVEALDGTILAEPRPALRLTVPDRGTPHPSSARPS